MNTCFLLSAKSDLLASSQTIMYSDKFAKISIWVISVHRVNFMPIFPYHTFMHTHTQVFIYEAHFHIPYTSRCFGVNAAPLWLVAPNPTQQRPNCVVISSMLSTFHLFFLPYFPAFARSNEAVKVYKSLAWILTWIAELFSWICTSLPTSAWVPMYSVYYNKCARYGTVRVCFWRIWQTVIIIIVTAAVSVTLL